MKKMILIALCIITTSISYSQSDTLQTKLNSILKEADLLYNYEKTAWNASDLLMSKAKLKRNYGGYVIYHSNDTIYASFIDKTQKNRIAKYSFVMANLNKPFDIDTKKSELSNIEQKYLDVKIKIIKQLSDPKYKIGFPEGFNPNLVLLKEPQGYKLYILMGTTKPGLIPFGNDYLFHSDLNGKIIEWQKFHSRVIPAYSKMPNGTVVISAVHSHLKTTPYITPTDICTFRLYGNLVGMKEFMVLSTSLGKYFKYNIDTNTIEVTEP
ncbi:hypothetical protein [Tenacibaculum aiptasiae]|uniref:hypothetical protein n=1 Tax=Tenacibaculum aiptasiae TaxID=426481 RepID=UPI00232E337D|nr:hypothetical protein [Tenacibaculum aiptasiae]